MAHHSSSATGDIYANSLPDVDGDQQAASSKNYDRTGEIKNEWCPEKLFRLNHEFEPKKWAQP
jgi:hypothetical protein